MKRNPSGDTRVQPEQTQSRWSPGVSESRSVVILAAPLTQLLDLAGPYQVFKRAVDVVLAQDPKATPPYCVEVATTRRGLLQTCSGLRVQGHRNFNEVGEGIDTLIVVGGTYVEEGRV